MMTKDDTALVSHLGPKPLFHEFKGAAHRGVQSQIRSRDNVFGQGLPPNVGVGKLDVLGKGKDLRRGKFCGKNQSRKGTRPLGVGQKRTTPFRKGGDIGKELRQRVLKIQVYLKKGGGKAKSDRKKRKRGKSAALRPGHLRNRITQIIKKTHR